MQKNNNKKKVQLHMQIYEYIVFIDLQLKINFIFYFLM